MPCLPCFSALGPLFRPPFSTTLAVTRYVVAKMNRSYTLSVPCPVFGLLAPVSLPFGPTLVAVSETDP